MRISCILHRRWRPGLNAPDMQYLLPNFIIQQNTDSDFQRTESTEYVFSTTVVFDTMVKGFQPFDFPGFVTGEPSPCLCLTVSCNGAKFVKLADRLHNFKIGGIT